MEQVDRSISLTYTLCLGASKKAPNIRAIVDLPAPLSPTSIIGLLRYTCKVIALIPLFVSG